MEHKTTVRTAVSEKRLFDPEKLKNCFECGICTASCSMTEILGSEYHPRNLLEKAFLKNDILDSEAIWLCAWCYRCQKHCPQNMNLPEIFLAFRKKAAEQPNLKSYKKALQKIAKNIPLPLVTTMVCFHPERAGLDLDQAVADIEKYREESSKSKKKGKFFKSSKPDVAVIGSGPAGLTVASELSHRGHSVTVFESLQELGGMLRKCIPEFRLPKEIVSKEVDFIRDMGVDFQTGTTVGKKPSFEDLQKEGYKAFFLSVGAHKTRNPRIKGSDLKGVVDALEFLWESNCDKQVKIGKQVIVIGGGNVAIDAARTALNLGAEHVTIAYRRSENEMPANPWEIQEAREHKVKIDFLIAPKEILGADGKVKGVEFIKMQLGEPDESGRRSITSIEGSEFNREADMIILAIGEAPDTSFLPKGILTNEDGTIWVNPLTMETSMPGIYSGGDAVTGPATVIEAIRDGKRAAESIHNFIKHKGEG